MLFSLAEVKFIQSNQGVLLSINQNRALIKRKFLSSLISTNKNRASIVMKFSTSLMLTNQN